MKRIILAMAALILIPAMQACQPTSAMVTAEIEFYKMQAEIMKNQSGSGQPLLQIKAQDASRDMIFQNVAEIIVYAPPLPSSGPTIKQYEMRDYSLPWVAMAGNVLTLGVGMAGVYGLAHELRNFSQGTTTNYNAMGSNSNIKTQGATTATISGGTNTVGPIDGTTPQQVVRPEIVNPVVVETPAPVIVQ